MLKTVTLSEMLEGKTPVTIESGSTVVEAAKVMSQANKGSVLVVSGGRLQGIFTERDLMRRVVAAGMDPSTTKVDQVMTRELVVGRPQDGHHMGIRRMVSARCRHLPVVDGDRLMGLVSRRDLMAIDIQQLEEEIDRRDPASLFI